MSEMQLGERIITLREIAGLNRSELARMMGVTPQAIQKWEAGGGLRVERLQELADALNCTLDDLISSEGPKQIVMTEKKQIPPSRLADQFVVRFPEGMRDKIAEAAKANNRSMNAEIVARLESSSTGLSVRDHFAAMALAPLIASGSWTVGSGPSAENEILAAAAYAVADAMLIERNK